MKRGIGFLALGLVACSFPFSYTLNLRVRLLWPRTPRDGFLALLLAVLVLGVVGNLLPEGPREVALGPVRLGGVEAMSFAGEGVAGQVAGVLGLGLCPGAGGVPSSGMPAPQGGAQPLAPGQGWGYPGQEAPNLPEGPGLPGGGFGGAFP